MLQRLPASPWSRCCWQPCCSRQDWPGVRHRACGRRHGRTWRGDGGAQRRMRAVSEFLRSRIGGAQGIVFNLDPVSGQAQRFTGDSRSMSFVSDLPDYLGRGGPHLHELGVARVAGGQALLVDFRMVAAGRAIVTPDARPPEPLADGLSSMLFSYRANSKDDQPRSWQPNWEYPEALPLQVRVQIADARVHGLTWSFRFRRRLPTASRRGTTSEVPPGCCASPARRSVVTGDVVDPVAQRAGCRLCNVCADRIDAGQRSGPHRRGARSRACGDRIRRLTHAGSGSRTALGAGRPRLPDRFR